MSDCDLNSIEGFYRLSKLDLFGGLNGRKIAKI